MNATAIAELALFTGLSIQETIVLEKTLKLIDTANDKFSISLPDIDIKFDLRGYSAGQAIKSGSKYTIRYNKELIHNNSLLTMINDIIPHELAHIIVMFKAWGKGHDKYWRFVCRELGGSGERLHNEAVESCHKRRTFAYTLENGKQCRVGLTVHKRIQAGKEYYTKKGYLLPINAWKEVNMSYYYDVTCEEE